MGSASYISVIERYHEYRDAIRELLASILTGVAERRLLHDPAARGEALRCLAAHYPFVDILFTLDASGLQTSQNVGSQPSASACDPVASEVAGRDRSQRPYFVLARAQEGVVVTEPYLSSASRKLCLSTAIRTVDAQGVVCGYIVLDIDLSKIIEFLMGDTARRRFQGPFKMIYSLIVLGLMLVVAVLLYNAFDQLFELTQAESRGIDRRLHPFGVVIFLTLALAVFDLGKTVLEEEVLMHKDVYRHSSTRRTITRFIAAILIAVSIEALLLMFKSALGDGDYVVKAVWMMFAAVGLLVGLGVYVHLGAKAEIALRGQRGGAR